MYFNITWNWIDKIYCDFFQCVYVKWVLHASFKAHIALNAMAKWSENSNTQNIKYQQQIQSQTNKRTAEAIEMREKKGFSLLTMDLKKTIHVPFSIFFIRLQLFSLHFYFYLSWFVILALLFRLLSSYFYGSYFCTWFGIRWSYFVVLFAHLRHCTPFFQLFDILFLLCTFAISLCLSSSHLIWFVHYVSSSFSMLCA